ncbi:MAG: mechanosensitive ion channel [Hyphomicrobiales bacterium]
MRRRLAYTLVVVMLALVPALTSYAAGTQRDGTYADITIDRSTPERHLATFLGAVDRTVLRMKAREWARSYYDAWLYPAIGPRQAAEIELLKKDVLDSMDLSAVPEWRRESAGLETAFMLWEILKAEGVSRNTAFRKLREGLWVIPGTYIQVGTIDSGMRMGDVVFTADMVANVPSLYDAVIGAHGSDGFSPYRYLTETPGGLTPPRWAGISQKLPAFLRWDYGSNTVFQWLIAALILVAVLSIPVAVGRLVGRRGLRWFSEAVVMGLLSLHATGIVVDEAGLSGAGATAMTLVFMTLFYGAMIVCVLIVGEWIGNWLSAALSRSDPTFDTSIAHLATRIVSAMAALGIVIYGISAAGVPVYGIIAGFGVGGLAVALAAKPTLENILAGVILFLDGSIKVGDTIDSSPLSGTIEDIGMRSTRIRAADGSLITVTNSELADKVIRNVSRRVARPGDGPAAETP